MVMLVNGINICDIQGSFIQVKHPSREIWAEYKYNVQTTGLERKEKVCLKFSSIFHETSNMPEFNYS